MGTSTCIFNFIICFQGNLLLQDYSHKIHLSNGLIVDASVLGVASIDLSGKVIISLWYKNSHSVITNRYVDVFKQSLLYILHLSIISLYTCNIFLCVSKLICFSPLQWGIGHRGLTTNWFRGTQIRNSILHWIRGLYRFSNWCRLCWDACENVSTNEKTSYILKVCKNWCLIFQFKTSGT